MNNVTIKAIKRHANILKFGVKCKWLKPNEAWRLLIEFTEKYDNVEKSEFSEEPVIFIRSSWRSLFDIIPAHYFFNH